MKRKTAIAAAAALLGLLALAPLLAAQDAVSADLFFQSVHERYLGIKDYEAGITITMGKAVMSGDVIYKNPELLRIDFSSPAGQVIAFDHEELLIYIPDARAVLRQSIAGSGGAGSASLASPKGLSMMKASYSISYETGPAPVPLGGGSSASVVKLLLKRKGGGESFTQIKLSVDPATKIILRVEGTLTSGETVTLDFSGVRTNVGIPDAKFAFDMPATANIYDNFLFRTE